MTFIYAMLMSGDEAGGQAMAVVITLIWWLYGYRLWKQARREGCFALV